MKFKIKDIDIRHKGKTYPEGSEIELTAEEAANIEKRFLEEIPEKKDSSDKKDGKKK